MNDSAKSVCGKAYDSSNTVKLSKKGSCKLNDRLLDSKHHEYMDQRLKILRTAPKNV